MHWFRRGFLVVFSVTFLAALFFMITNIGKQSKNPPSFEKNEENIVVSLENCREELLGDVRAFDSKGQDISEKIAIKSIAKAEGKERFWVTYIVFDEKGISSEYTVDAVIQGYCSPRVELKFPLLYSLDGSGYIVDALKITDVFDGDISYKAKIMTTDMDHDAPGIYTLLVQVENSVGDIVTLPLKSIVRHQSGSGYVMTLTDNIVYVKRGDIVDPESYVKDFHRYDTVTQLNLQVPYEEVQTLYVGNPEYDSVYHIVYYIPETSNIGWAADASGRNEVFFDMTGKYDYPSFEAAFSGSGLKELKFKSAVVLTVVVED